MLFGFSFLFVCIGGGHSLGSESKPSGTAMSFDFILVGSIPILSYLRVALAACVSLQSSPLGRSGEVGKLSSWEERERGGGDYPVGRGARGFRLRNNPRD